MAGEGEKEGLAAAVDATVDTSEPPADQAEQPALPLDPPQVAGQAMQVPQPRRGRGRPPGSKNKRTEDWTEFLLSRGRSPLMVLQDAYSLPVEELADRLNCKIEEAFKIQLAAAEKLAPYLHQKQPVAVEVDENRVVRLVLAEGGDFDGAAIADDGLQITAVDADYETVGNQEVSAEDPGKLDSRELDK